MYRISLTPCSFSLTPHTRNTVISFQAWSRHKSSGIFCIIKSFHHLIKYVAFVWNDGYIMVIYKHTNVHTHVTVLKLKAIKRLCLSRKLSNILFTHLYIILQKQKTVIDFVYLVRINRSCTIQLLHACTRRRYNLSLSKTVDHQFITLTKHQSYSSLDTWELNTHSKRNVIRINLHNFHDWWVLEFYKLHTFFQIE